jgi:cytochrome oxidase assembly protein ShyY1
MNTRRRIPTSLILFGLIAIVASIGFVRLGFWQLDRHLEVQHSNEVINARLVLEPLELNAAAVHSLDMDSLLWRRVEFSGRWDFDREVVIRSRARSGTPGIHVVTPLQLDSETSGGIAHHRSVLVLRGWLPSPNPAVAELAAARHEASVSPGSPRLGLIRASRSGHGTPMINLGSDSTAVPSYAAIDVQLIAGGDDEILPFFLQLLPNDAQDANRFGQPYPVALPALDNGPHLIYMIQWFAFALITVVGSSVFIRRERRRLAIQETPC